MKRFVIALLLIILISATAFFCIQGFWDDDIEPGDNTYSISLKEGEGNKYITSFPDEKCAAGLAVEIETKAIVYADISICVNGEIIDKTNSTDEAFVFSFVMPECDVEISIVLSPQDSVSLSDHEKWLSRLTSGDIEYIKASDLQSPLSSWEIDEHFYINDTEAIEYYLDKLKSLKLTILPNNEIPIGGSPFIMTFVTKGGTEYSVSFGTGGIYQNTVEDNFYSTSWIPKVEKEHQEKKTFSFCNSILNDNDERDLYTYTDNPVKAGTISGFTEVEFVEFDGTIESEPLYYIGESENARIYIYSETVFARKTVFDAAGLYQETTLWYELCDGTTFNDLIKNNS